MTITKYDSLAILSIRDKYNLKSKLAQYLAAAQLFNEDNDLELWCDDKADEAKFMHWFVENSDTL